MAAGQISAVALEAELTPGNWTDLAPGWDWNNNALTISAGRVGRSSKVQPGVLSVRLDNPAGLYTPDNPLSTFYPNLVEGKRIRCRLTRGTSTPATVAIDATGSAPAGAGATRATASWSHTVGASATILLVFLDWSPGVTPATVTSITYGSQTLTKLDSVVDTSSSTNRQADIWYLLNPTPGTNTVTYTLNGSVASGASSASFSGVSTSAPFGTVVKNAATTGTSDSLTAAGGSMIVATEAARTTTLATVGASQTTIANYLTGGATNLDCIATYQAAGTTTTFTWSVSDEHAAIAVALMPGTVGTTSTRFVGRITDISPAFPADAVPYVTITATDKLADLDGITLESALTETITNAAAPGSVNYPGDYFPLDEASGAVTALPGMPAACATTQLSSFGSVKFGDSNGPSGGSAVTLSAGSYLYGAPTLADPSGIGGVGLVFYKSLTLWFTVPVGQSGTLFTLTDGTQRLSMNVGPSGHLRIFKQVGSTVVSDGTIDLGPVVADGVCHQLLVSDYSLAGTAATCYVSFQVDGKNQASMGPYTGAAGGSTYSKIVLGGGSGQVSIAQFATYPTDLLGASIAGQQLNAGQLGTSGGRTLDNRMTELTQWTGITCAFDGTNSRAAVAPASSGKSGLDVLLEIANSESGIVYHDYAADSIVALRTSTARPEAIGVTLDAVTDLATGPQNSRNVNGRIGTANVSNPVSKVTVTDTSTTRTASVDVATVLASTNDMYAVGSDQIARTKYARLRIAQAVVDLVTAENDLYSAMWALDLGGRVRVTSIRATDYGRTYDDGYLAGYVETLGLGSYTFALDLDPADAPAEGRFNDTTYASFSWGDGVATVTGGTAVGTTGTGTLIITTSGTGPTLTLTAGAYPLLLDWNGECVQIGAAPASATSPQTVTITARGQQGTVARAHAAGEPVDIWLAARYAL